MPSPDATPLFLAVDQKTRVSALLQVPRQTRACFVLAHGAGAGMTHPFMAGIAQELARFKIASLRYQFPYMEQGSKRPDVPSCAHATVRAAVAEAFRLLPDLPLFAGGKSFGGRMTSQAQALSPLPGVRGLGFLGFPLHPAGDPSTARSQHLFDIELPMLFLQGTRDALAEIVLLEALCKELGARATLVKVQNGDHSFHLPARSGPTDAEIQASLAHTVATWIQTCLEMPGPERKC